MEASGIETDILPNPKPVNIGPHQPEGKATECGYRQGSLARMPMQSARERYVAGTKSPGKLRPQRVLDHDGELKADAGQCAKRGKGYDGDRSKHCSDGNGESLETQSVADRDGHKAERRRRHLPDRLPAGMTNSEANPGTQ